MIKMVMNPGDEEQVYDLKETPSFLLVQFSESIIRHQDLRNPQTQNTLREFVDALKAKEDNSTKDGFTCSINIGRSELKEIITTIENLLERVSEECAAE
jgi:hypothetical protein